MPLRSLLLLALPLAGCVDVTLRPIDEKPDETDVVDTVVVDTVVVDTELPPPEIDVSPTSLAFAADQPTGSFVVTNLGEGPLIVSEVRIEGPAFSLLVPGGFRLESGDSRAVDVGFSIIAPGAQAGTVTVVSNDDDEGEVPVALDGFADVPWVSLAPADLDYGDVLVRCSTRADLVVSNVGTRDLVIDGYALSGATPYVTIFDGPEVPLTLVPGASEAITTRFAPDSEGISSDTLTFTSNDPRGDVGFRQQGNGVYEDVITETFELEDDPPIDMLIALDSTPSMNQTRQRLGTYFNVLTSALSTVTTDWRIGIVTLGSGCFNEVVTPATSSADIISAVRAPGSDHSEDMFWLAQKALVAADVGGCNEGFRRPDASLHLVLVSDNNVAGVDAFMNFLISYEERAKVSAVVGIDPSPCYVERVGAAYATAVGATGGRLLSICDDWTPNLTDLGAYTSSGLSSVTLSGVPDPISLKVWVDGVRQTTGWTYDPDTNTIFLDGDPSGLTVEVRYGVLGECP